MKMEVYRSTKKPKLLVPIMHSKTEIDFLTSVIRDYKINLFVEIGNWCGGITLVVHQRFPDLEICSFDIASIPGNIQPLFNGNVSFIIQDVMQDIALLKRILSSPGRKLLYCDGGNKSAEINRYTKYLHHNDIVGLHDCDETTENRIKDTVDNFELIKTELKVSNKFWIKGT